MKIYSNASALKASSEMCHNTRILCRNGHAFELTILPFPRCCSQPLYDEIFQAYFTLFRTWAVASIGNAENTPRGANVLLKAYGVNTDYSKISQCATSRQISISSAACLIDLFELDGVMVTLP